MTMGKKNTPTLASFLLIALTALDGLAAAREELSCQTDADCEARYRVGSECLSDGTCSNPFHKGGCLKTLLPAWDKIRVCGSQDPFSAMEQGYCRSSPLDYGEVRLSANNWESAFIGTWIVQILLNELLDVPVSIDMGIQGANSSEFYNVDNRFDLLHGVDWKSLETSHEVVDCRQLEEEQGEQEEYISCAHAMAEAWTVYKPALVGDLMERGVIDEPSLLGMRARDAWFVSKRTIEKDPSLISYFGLGGEEHRRKLAEMFLMPTTWGEYCAEVSESNCKEPDSVAAKAPSNDEEKTKYFVQGLYTGHFRKTDINDCDANPDSCTGIFLDYECGWSVNTYQKIIHTNTALTPISFSPLDTVDIITAANATKNNVIHWWYEPNSLVELYRGTDGEFIPVFFAEPTVECLENRANFEDRCGGDPIKAAGSPDGVCSDPPTDLTKVIATSLQLLSENPEVDPALWSPAYQAIAKYKLSNHQLADIFQMMHQRGGGAYAIRDATCEWVAENIDDLQSLIIPPFFPRAIEQEDDDKRIRVAALAMSAIALVLVVASAITTHARRNKVSVYHAQEKVCYLVLLGLSILACGAMLMALPPTDAVCMSAMWLVNLGFCIAVIPLLQKIEMINRAIGNNNSRMKRVRLKLHQLTQWLVVVGGLVTAFLVTWSIMDPPHKATQYEMTESLNDRNETIVLSVDICESDTEYWLFGSILWMGSVVTCGLLLSVLASRVQDDLNRAKSFATLFLVLGVLSLFQLVFFSLGDAIDNTDLYLSIFLSLDCIAIVAVYIAPRLTDSEDHNKDDPKPDLFLHTSVMMADLVNFTQWSSMREPSDVFSLLETIFGKFEDLAERRGGVFKVESVGDCFVFATGIPHGNKNHALTMARFARDILSSMNGLVDQLELMYGPSSELDLRIGIHSGPVSGGFIKGKGSRFQLLGDTMNTCSRMESAGAAGKIHVSERFAQELKKAGKSSWVIKRNELIDCKGKGSLQTYWLRNSRLRGGGKLMNDESMVAGDNDRLSQASFGDADLTEICQDPSEKQMSNLIQWNVEVLLRFLREIVAHRNAEHKTASTNLALIDNGCTMPLDEVKEIITLPEFNRRTASRKENADKVVLDDMVVTQLHQLVTEIAHGYNDNPFHSFSHASHVVMGVTKHLNRIIAPSNLDNEGDRKSGKLHDHTYGITGDPLTQFACIFAALIHDLDHPGVPNNRFEVENELLAAAYKGRSIAEQNSLDLAWAMFTKDDYKEFRSTLCGDINGLQRFRSLVVNSVMATDLADKELKALRNRRWEKAFACQWEKSSVCGSIDGSTSGTTDDSWDPHFSSRNSTSASRSRGSSSSSSSQQRSRKATIVIEHLIQASDVVHTMQHWHVYRQWNENLFREMYYAFKAGRSDKSPEEFWYDGEIGFFDFYIIPLSQKLRDCGVFGISSDENLSYALSNREEWIKRGKEVVAEMVAKLEKEFESGGRSIPAATKVDDPAGAVLRAEKPESAPLLREGETKLMNPAETDIFV